MIEKYFPYDSFRPNQKEVIADVIEAIESDYEHIIVDAPTGFGKSAVVQTINDILVHNDDYNSFILTATRNLQNQYWKSCKDDEFADYQVMMGRSNYACPMSGTTCDRGLCRTTPRSVGFKCMYNMKGNPCDNGGCNYYSSKCRNMVADTSIMNYNVLMSDMQYAHHFDSRSLMFCDEAHNIEDKIMNAVSLSFNENKMYKLFDISFNDSDYEDTDINSWIDKLETILPICQHKAQAVDSIFSDYDKKRVQEIKSFTKQLEWKLHEIKKGHVDWVVCPNHRGRTIEIKPISIQPYSYGQLLNGARTHVYLSGSFIDHEQWASDLGLDDGLTRYIRTESSFDMVNRNPIIKKWIGNMSMNDKAKTLPKMANAISDILDAHPNECGIIHCHSKDNANYIMSNVHSGRLMTYTPENKDKQLETFENSSNLVMVAYSLEEGVDLPYDGVRFQVFMKTPYPNLADNQIRARMVKDNHWYRVNTARKLVQAWGRGMRAEDDYCVNYMLDTGFNALTHANWMPKELVGALIHEKERERSSCR